MDQLTSFVNFLGLCFFVANRTTAVTYETTTLMFLSEGAGVNFVNTWTGTALNDPANDKQTWSAKSLISTGDFRSANVDSWTSLNAPVEVHLKAYNNQGDALWEVVFDGNGCHFAIGCWMVPGRILSCKSSTSSSSTAISVSSNPASQMHITSSSDTNLIWFTLWNADLLASPNPPMFLFSNDITTPFPVSTEETVPSGPTVISFEGCFSLSIFGATFMLQDIASMSVASCQTLCTPPYDLVILEVQVNCYCAVQGSLVLPSPFPDGACDKACPGDPTSWCGDLSTIGAVYTYTAITSLVTVPTYSDVEGTVNIPATLVAGSNEIQVDVTSHLGDASNAGFITRLSLTYTPSTTYTLDYSSLPCSSNSRNSLDPVSGLTMPFPSDGTVVATGVLEVRCLWFVFASPAISPTSVRVILYHQNETKFISAPYIAVHVVHAIETTTTKVATTTTTTALTTTTTTEPPTTIAETTTTAAPTTTTGAAITSTTAESTTTTTTGEATETTCTSTTAATTTSTTSCLCHCVQNRTLSPQQLSQLIKALQDNLRVTKTELSSYVRTKTSAADDRMSAKSLGSFGAAIIASVFMCVIVIDFTNFMKLPKKQKVNPKPSSNEPASKSDELPSD